MKKPLLGPGDRPMDKGTSALGIGPNGGLCVDPSCILPQMKLTVSDVIGDKRTLTFLVDGVAVREICEDAAQTLQVFYDYTGRAAGTATVFPCTDFVRSTLMNTLLSSLLHGVD